MSDKIRAIVDGEEVVGWYVYACRTAVSAEIYWQHEIYVPNKIGFTHWHVIDPALAAVDTGKDDKNGNRIFGSKGIFQGGDRVLSGGGGKYRVEWSEKFVAWSISDEHGTYYGSLWDAETFEISPKEE